MKNLMLFMLCLFIATLGMICIKESKRVHVQDNEYEYYHKQYPKLQHKIFVMLKQATSIARVDIADMLSLIQSESGFDNTAVSRCGALGLTQVMPGTAAYYKRLCPWKEYDNLLIGSLEYRACLHKAKYDKIEAFRMYNAGKSYKRIHGDYPEVTKKYAAGCVARLNQQSMALL